MVPPVHEAAGGAFRGDRVQPIAATLQFLSVSSPASIIPHPSLRAKLHSSRQTVDAHPNLFIIEGRRNDPQYAAAIHLFHAIGRGHEYIVQGGIDNEQLLEDSRAWSHGEQIVIKIALDLFDPGCVPASGAKSAGWGEAGAVLSDRLISAVTEAIRIIRA